MHGPTTFLVSLACLTTTSFARVYRYHPLPTPAIKREAAPRASPSPTPTPSAIIDLARRATADDGACESSYEALIDSVPTPTGSPEEQIELLSSLAAYIATADTADPSMYCDVITAALPDARMRHNYRVWNIEMERWCISNSQSLDALATVCDSSDGKTESPLWAQIDCAAMVAYVSDGCENTDAPVTLTSLDGAPMPTPNAFAGATAAARFAGAAAAMM